MKKSRFLKGKPIAPPAISPETTLVELIDQTFLAYNSSRLREACELLSEKVLKENVLVGLSLTGALTPAGLGQSCLIPLMEAGFVDWISSSGANLYHDLHYALNLSLHQGTPFILDTALRSQGVIRIYDVFFDSQVLLQTDAFLRDLISGGEFQKTMGTSEFHHLLGKHLSQRGKSHGSRYKSILATAYSFGIPVYSPAPGDSSIWMNVAALALNGKGPKLDISHDVNETAALVYDIKSRGGESAVWILGGGAPKNFMLQTEPHIQEILQLAEKGHDYFIQITDARPDSGGLSGATPSEAVSWGKVDPQKLPHAVVCYTDITIALPLLTAYLLKKNRRRKPKRLYGRRDELIKNLRKKYLEEGKNHD